MDIRSGRHHQRVEWKFIKNRKRLLAFTKRKDEIFKEASELCTILGVSIVVSITSLCGKIYSFAHPNVDSVESQFLYHTLLPPSILEPYREVHIKELNIQLDNVRGKLEGEEKRAKVLKDILLIRYILLEFYITCYPDSVFTICSCDKASDSTFDRCMILSILIEGELKAGKPVQ